MSQKASLKNRFILVAVTMSILIAIFVSYTQILVNQTAKLTLKASRDSRELSGLIRDIKNTIHIIESNMYQYSALNDDVLRVTLAKNIRDLDTQVKKINQRWSKVDFSVADSGPQKRQAMNSRTVNIQLQNDVQALHEQVRKFLVITTSVETKFPGMIILTQELVPRNIKFMNQVNLAIAEGKEIPHDVNTEKIKYLFDEIRFAWSQQVSLVRLFVTNRSGTFGNPVQSMKRNLINRDIYVEKIKTNLNQLLEFNKNDMLGFVQSESVLDMQKIHIEYEAYFNQALKVYLSDNWRVDLTLLRDDLRPAIVSVWSTVSLLENFLKEYTEYSTELSNRTASSISIFIWIFTAVILLLLLTGYFTFDIFIRKPIQHVASALDAVAKGKEIEQKINVHSEETELLVNAFENMQAQVNSRQSRLESILENAGEGVITIDERGIIETFNTAAQMLFGYDSKEILGKNVSLLTPDSVADNHSQYILKYQESGVSKIVGNKRELTGKRKDSTLFPISLKVSELIVDGQKLYTALIEDISDSKAMMEDLQKLAERDSLTGLYNRFYFTAELERVTERSKRKKYINCALFYIDLDNFKYVNDTLGHLAGDQLLIEVTTLFSSKLRRSDLLARLGGDEFAVIIYDVTQTIAEKIANTLREFMQDYIFIQNGKSIHVGCSIGLAMFDQDILSKEDLLARADFACHAAKKSGRNLVHVYTQSDDKQRDNLSEDIGWAKRIKDALNDNRFVLAKQPIYDIKKQYITKYEVLLRMLDESDGLVMPAGFLPPAERFGLIHDIDKWVVTHAIQELAAINEGRSDIFYSINLSAKSFENDEIITCITDEISRYNLPASLLIFEITETAAMADISLTIKFMKKLQNLGCQIALDDFGVGYSSFSHLKSLPVDYVKIDGSFVKDITDNEVSYAVVKSMNDISHTMGKKTVAEFVETEQCLILLAKIGIDYAQGYYIGKPSNDINNHIEQVINK